MEIRYDRTDEASASTDAGVEVRRWDFSALGSIKTTQEGFLRADGYITRAGVFLYTTPDGTTRRELRPPDEVFHQDSLDSFALIPLTLGHPPDNLTPASVAQHQVGTVGTPERMSHLVRAPLLITRQDAIEALKRGVNKLSCGYKCKLVEQSGVFVDGSGREERFDAVQRSIVGNHIAMVRNPRAGPEAAIRTDSTDAFSEVDNDDVQSRKDAPMKLTKISINGKAFDVSDEMAQAYALERSDAKDRDAEIAQLRGELEAVKSRTRETDDSKKRFDEINARAKERVEILTKAAPILGKDIESLSSMSDVEIMRASVASAFPHMRLDDSDAQLQNVIVGAFRAIAPRVNTPERIQEIVNSAKKRTDENRQDDTSAVSARARMIARDSDAWKSDALRKAEDRSRDRSSR